MLNTQQPVPPFTFMLALALIFVACAPAPTPVPPLEVTQPTASATQPQPTATLTPRPTPTTTNPALQAALEKIRGEYLKQMEASGFKPSWVPAIRIEYTPKLMYHHPGQRTIYVSDWANLSAEEKALFDQWASFAAEGATGQSLFAEMFHWFFFPHEVGHDTQKQLQIESSGPYEVEYNATEWAVAFWKTQPGAEERVRRVERAARRIWERLPNPVPAGQDSRAYFNENYTKGIISNTPAYGYFQFSFLMDIMDRRQELIFGAMVQAALKNQSK
ncbi:MAG: hypothetical protein HY782_09170 [Chloroflexi bacterium]|nr:hypothetical protein [Chloroflexota bacterium]